MRAGARNRGLKDVMISENSSSSETCASHIIFVGFMGAGKSSVARKLASSEGMSSIDMDSAIEREAGMSIQEIFGTEGEEGFRIRESEFLRSLPAMTRSIVSCGGGVVVRAENRELLKRLGTVVYLKVDAAEAVSRIAQPKTRPLLAGTMSPAEILAARLRYYEEVADITVDTMGYSIPQVAHAVRSALRARGKL
jgi:shikimate kinase